MTSNIKKIQILAIYKLLIRESKKFTNYNFRNYALRRVRDAFRENKSITDPQEIQKLYNFAQENLTVVRRQVIIGHMYGTEKLVIENKG